jgi:TolB-like protein/Tfp pilus assembly protein PilF
MKRCPECRRAYTDETLNFCLDDGAWLREVGDDEPATAIQPPAERTIEPSASGKSTIEETVLLARHLQQGDVQRPTSSAEYLIKEASKHRGVLAIVATAVLVAVVGFGYFYLKSFSRSLTSSPIASIAVLPFQNKNSDPDTDYLSDGLAESLIFRLTQLPGLKVSPTSSVMRYKDKDADASKIAGELGVDAVMTGRLVKRGDNLNITVELVDTRDNKTLWGEQYDRKIADLLATQREIAATIVQKLQLTLSGTESKGLTKQYTNNNEAYQLWLKGRFHFARRTKDEIAKSIDAFEQAVALDPKFALGYVGIAESYAVMPSYPYASPAESVPKAKAAVAKALEIDPDLPQAHTVAGMIAATYDWDWAKAEEEFKRALELDPNLAITHYRYAWTFLSPLGRHDEAIAEMKKAMELEPLSTAQGANYAAVLLYARRYDDALDQARKTYDMDPENPTPKNWMCHTLNMKGMYAESLVISEPTLNGTGNKLLNAASFAYAKSGRRKEAQDIVERWQHPEPPQYVTNYWVAVTYAAVGDKDAAFDQLEKAYKNRDWFLQRIKVDPMMDPLRDDPRFDEMVRRLKFPE